MIEEKKEHMFEVFESKISDFESVSSEPISCEVFKVEMTTLCELAAPNLQAQSLSITYPVLDRHLSLTLNF